jgi:hypothetical protein
MISAEFLNTVYVLVYACTGLVGRTDTSTSIRMEVVWNTQYTCINNTLELVVYELEMG